MDETGLKTPNCFLWVCGGGGGGVFGKRGAKKRKTKVTN